MITKQEFFELWWYTESSPKINAILNKLAQGIFGQTTAQVAEEVRQANLAGYKESMCGHCGKNPAEELHSCPYAEDINNDYDPEYCNCCSNCTSECCQDI